MALRALITWGGWDGHEPDKIAALFEGILRDAGAEVDVFDTLACLDDAEVVAGYDLIVPIWTMSEITKEQSENVSEAVARGTGLAGCHGGMCDAFRANVLWQFMTGANWVAHPGGDGVDYRVKITAPENELVSEIADFEVCSEQYYLHVDPANVVLATTVVESVTWYHTPNGAIEMPVAWTKRWGMGRVYYNALGHHADVIDHGAALEMMRRGLVWALESKAAASERDDAHGDYVSAGNHY